MKNAKLVALLDSNEKLLFADKVKKFRSNCTWKQDRILVITTENIYNVKKDKVKRCMKIESLGGVTKSLLGAKTEFIIHIPKEYDYRYLSEKRTEVIEILKHRFAEKMNDNLPIYGVEKDRTNEFMTIEKDMKRGVSKMPPS